MYRRRSDRADGASNQKEEGFNLSFCTDKSAKSALNEYNALHDTNMRHYFENPVVQKHLYKTGQIDRSGRVVDLDKNKSKLHIIDQEFRHAERLEEQRRQEEEDMRARVQQKRFAALEKARSDEALRKLKDDKTLRKEIMLAYNESRGVNQTLTRGTPSRSARSLNSTRQAKSRSPKPGSSSFEGRGVFVTAMQDSEMSFEYTKTNSDALDMFVQSR